MTLRLGFHRALQRIGVDLVRHDASTSITAARARLLRRHEIDLVVDVGANAGWYGAEVRASGYRGRIVSFEPVATTFAELLARAAGDRAWEVRHAALGSKDGKTSINVAANSWSSSLLPMAPIHLRAAPSSAYVAHEEVEVARLDTLRVVGPQDTALLKIDVQGSELEVLAGAEEALRQVRVLECELQLVPLYEGAPLVAEVVGWLDRRGFDAAWLGTTFVEPEAGDQLALDGLFVARDPELTLLP